MVFQKFSMPIEKIFLIFIPWFSTVKKLMTKVLKNFQLQNSILKFLIFVILIVNFNLLNLKNSLLQSVFNDIFAAKKTKLK